MKKYIISLDQGTTSSRAIIFDKNSNIIATAQKEITQIYPKAGWVEHCPLEIWETTYNSLRDVIKKSNITAEQISAIGITNQRETTVIWDKKTGKPIYNAIVWQCRRTAQICEELKLKNGYEKYIRNNTGLVVDAYFSSTKIKWILDNVKGAREKAENKELLFGTIDSWLVWNLTKGELHITDHTNASRTMLFNIKSLTWDKKILSSLNIPLSMMPKVKKSSEIYAYITLDFLPNKNKKCKVPIAGIVGDQQSALFGQACFNKGDIKNTYGTGCFLLMNTGKEIVQSKNGLLSTITATTDEDIHYALEGSVFVGGAAIQWLRDEMCLIKNAQETETYANKVKDTNGTYVVPAFTGLGAPHWDMYARGCIVGITRGTNKNHIIRATLESIAFQTKDLIDAMQIDSNIKINKLKVDGGAAANKFLLQFQSDILDIIVLKPKVTETTALGSAYLAGLAVGFWGNKEEISNSWKLDNLYKPNIEKKSKNTICNGWKKAIKKAKNWESDEL